MPAREDATKSAALPLLPPKPPRPSAQLEALVDALADLAADLFQEGRLGELDAPPADSGEQR